MAEANGAAPTDDRRKRTIWLLSGGAASLLLPLAGLAYIHWADTRPVPGPEGASDVFEHHDGQGPVIPSQITPNVVALPPGGGAAAKPVSSLDFVKPDPEFTARASAAAAAASGTAAAPVAAPATAASTATATAAAVSAKQTAASSKKQFVMPKLQPGRGFTSFGSTGAGSSAAQQGGAASGANAQQLMNLPPGAANNPEIQKYLQSQQGH